MRRFWPVMVSLILLTACGGGATASVAGLSANAAGGTSTDQVLTASQSTQDFARGPAIDGMPWLSLSYDNVLEGVAANATGGTRPVDDGFKKVATTLWITNTIDQWQYLDPSSTRAAFQFQDTKGGLYNTEVAPSGLVPLPPEGSEQLTLIGEIPSLRDLTGIHVTLLTEADARVQVDLTPNPAGIPAVPLPKVGSLTTNPAFDCAGAVSVSLSDVHRVGNEIDTTFTITNNGNTSEYPGDLVNGTFYLLDADGTRISSSLWDLMKVADKGAEEDLLAPDQLYARTLALQLSPSGQSPDLIIAYVYLSQGESLPGRWAEEVQRHPHMARVGGLNNAVHGSR